jgi:hypothetical protein
VKAVQQQQQEITDDNAANTALKQQVSLLTAEIAVLQKDIADLKSAHAPKPQPSNHLIQNQFAVAHFANPLSRANLHALRSSDNDCPDSARGSRS